MGYAAPRGRHPGCAGSATSWSSSPMRSSREAPFGPHGQPRRRRARDRSRRSLDGLSRRAGRCRCAVAPPMSRRRDGQRTLADRRAPPPVCGEPLAVLGVEPVTERVADHLIGHDPGVPCHSQAQQSPVTARCFKDRLHALTMARRTSRSPPAPARRRRATVRRVSEGTYMAHRRRVRVPRPNIPPTGVRYRRVAAAGRDGRAAGAERYRSMSSRRMRGQPRE